MKPPQFFTDIYRDLRDRHLLLPAVVLLAGLVAVPMLLANEEPAPPAAAVVASSEPAATIPAVLADTEVSVRDYRKRLADLKSKNPFDQQFQVSTEDDAATGDPSLGGDLSVPGDAPAIDGGVPSSDTATTSTDPTTSGTDDTSGDSNQNDVEVVNQLFVRRVDVMVGVQGDLKRRKSVQPMTILPNQANPVTAFLGADEAGKRAAFVVSSDVTSVGGDGACVPSPNCLFITLEKGETATFDYAPDGQTYELKLLGIRDVKLKTD